MSNLGIWPGLYSFSSLSVGVVLDGVKLNHTDVVTRC
ncbi:hypothetical protein GA0070609_6565 [Micromonospora echinaurantiaca]|uniref:Uncharacterized protein n=1 Tax=Micromonospora echinaurantiaca TaxID=47857 RepID=A0A1C5KDC7_9ACTN|nr:hypothetical protein GA0070609_6565 [Micromonospora echinaurantiaca]